MRQAGEALPKRRQAVLIQKFGPHTPGGHVFA